MIPIFSELYLVDCCEKSIKDTCMCLKNEREKDSAEF